MDLSLCRKMLLKIKWWAMSMATYLQWLDNGHSIASLDWICCKGLREEHLLTLQVSHLT